MKKKTKNHDSRIEQSECRARMLTGRDSYCSAIADSTRYSRSKAVLLKVARSLPRSSSERTQPRSEACSTEGRALLHPHETARLSKANAVHRYPRAESRGQITAEFVITLVILFSLFSVIVFISVQQKENTDFNSNKIKAITLMEKTARAVNGVYLSGEGSETEITKEFDFEIGFEENVLMIKFSQGQFVSTSLITKKIVFTPAANSSKIKIINLNGVITVAEQ